MTLKDLNENLAFKKLCLILIRMDNRESKEFNRRGKCSFNKFALVHKREKTLEQLGSARFLHARVSWGAKRGIFEFM